MAGIPSDELATALQGFQEGCADSDAGFLRDFLKQGAQISGRRLARYGIELDTKMRNNGHSNGFDFYYDTPFNFCLTYDGELLASIGFTPERLLMFINQIQGVQGAGKELQEFKWTQAGVLYAMRWAEKHGIPQVGIQSVKNNTWARYTFNAFKSKGIYPRGMTFEQAMHLDYETGEMYRREAKSRGPYMNFMPHQGFMIYDVTARRCGFERRRDGDYVKSLGIS